MRSPHRHSRPPSAPVRAGCAFPVILPVGVPTQHSHSFRSSLKPSSSSSACTILVTRFVASEHSLSSTRHAAIRSSAVSSSPAAALSRHLGHLASSPMLSEGMAAILPGYGQGQGQGQGQGEGWVRVRIRIGVGLG